LRILGIDYGDSRIGLSLSDLLNITAQPLKVLHVEHGWKNVTPLIKDIIVEYNVKKVVIGYPINLDGTKGVRCDVTDRFIDVLLKEAGDIEILRWDERYTTKQAENILGKKEKSKGKHDIVSAVLILQSYLDFFSKKN
jgi:putative holliday junction resolvase